MNKENRKKKEDSRELETIKTKVNILLIIIEDTDSEEEEIKKKVYSAKPK